MIGGTGRFPLDLIGKRKGSILIFLNFCIRRIVLLCIIKIRQNRLKGNSSVRAGIFSGGKNPLGSCIVQPVFIVVFLVVPNLGNRFSHKIDDADTPKEYRNLIIS